MKAVLMAVDESGILVKPVDAPARAVASHARSTVSRLSTASRIA